MCRISHIMTRTWELPYAPAHSPCLQHVPAISSGANLAENEHWHISLGICPATHALFSAALCVVYARGCQLHNFELIATHCNDMQTLMHGKGPGNSPRAIEAINPTLAVATASHTYVESSWPQPSTFGERRSHDSQSSAAMPSASAITESMTLSDAVPGRLPSGRSKRLSASSYTATDAVPDTSVGGATVSKVLVPRTRPQGNASREEEWLWGPGDSPTAAGRIR